jgi:hypothetical protein
VKRIFSAILLFAAAANMFGYESWKDVSMSNRVQKAQFIAIVSITNAVTTTWGDGIHQIAGTNRIGVGTIDQIFKGHKLPEGLKVRQRVGTTSYSATLNPGRFLVFGIYSGASIVPIDFFCILPIVKTESGVELVHGRTTNTLAEVAAEIRKELPK